MDQMYRSELLDLETIYGVAPITLINMLAKFMPIIDEYKKFDYPADLFSNWEYMANELARMHIKRDPNWREGSTSHVRVARESVFNNLILASTRYNAVTCTLFEHSHQIRNRFY